MTSSFINPSFFRDNDSTSDSDSASVIDNIHDSSTISLPASFSSSTKNSTNSDAIDHHMLPRRSNLENRGVPPNRFGYKCVNSYIIPSTYDDAIKLPDSKQWLEAINCEINQLQKYSVFKKHRISNTANEDRSS
ncbi:hypothetical protein HUG17_7144 [Dermatophagoides farinae]|uniref:Uncharacterized protein n=1 Tax=Dermatophagoides farinae TaxID=6954 RepID=A0A9D4SCV2_DERFA|nr:hypothetical protein HUG17_7144 [Dermatophagoides farinae]